jgi:serine protease Do
MTDQRSRQPLTLLLVFGAVIFGMVLAGSLDFTAPSVGAPEPAPEPAPQTSSAPMVAGLPSLADLVDEVSPAVVSIEARAFESSRRRGGDPFEFFFGPRRRDNEEPEDEQEFRSDSGGSGFVISSEGLVVTNNHVVRGADEIKVHLGDEVYDAEVRGTDPATDLALLEIKPRNGGDMSFLPLGDSQRLRVGEWVMAVGSPLGLEDTVTVGVVSAKNRRINISQETQSFENFIQTDAAINFGNSGGPLINMAGEVVGINTAINFGSENIGFAVPVDILKRILPQLRDSGKVSRGYLGIGVNDLDRNAAEAYGLDSTDGALVSNVQSGLPADLAGLLPGDIILKADGNTVEDTRGLIDYVSAQGPGATVVLQVLRDGEMIDLDVDLVERPADGDEVEEEPEEDEGGIEWLGLRYQDVTPNMRNNHGVPDEIRGVWITSVSPRSPLYDEGVRTGQFISVITKVNSTEVDDVDSFEEAVREAEPGSRLRIYIRRFANSREIAPQFAFPRVPE